MTSPGNGAFRNERGNRLLGEALTRQVAGSPRPPPTSVEHSTRASGLGLERTERVLDKVGSDARALEIVPDERVAGATTREGGCPTVGKPAIVEDARPIQGRERFPALVLCEASSLESAFEVDRAQVAMAERPEGGLERCPSWLCHEGLAFYRRRLVDFQRFLRRRNRR